MWKTNKNKFVLIASLAAVIILSLVTLLSHPNFQVSQNKNQNTQEAYEVKLKQLEADYQKLLAETKTDPQASQQILAKVIDPIDFKNMIDEGLGVKETVPLTKLDEKQIVYSSGDGEGDMRTYISKLAAALNDFSSTHGDSLAPIVEESITQEEWLAVVSDIQNLINSKLYKIQVPKPAAEYHKSLISTYLGLKDILNAYEPEKLLEGKSPWPTLYHSHLAINEYIQHAQNAGQELEKRYPLAIILQEELAKQEAGSWAAQALGIKEAKALIPGLPSPTFTIGDIPRIIRDAIQDFFASSYTKFALQILDIYSKKLEQGSLIAHVGYYRDALVNVRYVDDYMQKYVPDIKPNSPEGKLIKSFIPEVGCGKPVSEAQRKLIDKQVLDYLGFDPDQGVDVDDPDFYTKLGRVGHFPVQGSGAGTKLILESMASVIGSKARETAQTELGIPHQKVPVVNETGAVGGGLTGGIAGGINPVGGFKTAKSLSFLQAETFSALGAQIQLGNPNAGTVASAIWMLNIGKLINKFLLLGSTIKEQVTCIDTPQFQTITPVDAPNRDNVVDQKLLNCYKQLNKPNVFDQRTGVGSIDEDAKLDTSVECVINALEEIAVGRGSGRNPDGSGDTSGGGLNMNKACYIVGEVPRFAIHGAPPDNLIYWSLYKLPSGEAVFTNQNFEDTSGPQSTDDNGDWPSATGTIPRPTGFETSEIGQFRRTAVIGDKIYDFVYKVVANRNDCLASRN